MTGEMSICSVESRDVQQQQNFLLKPVWSKAKTSSPPGKAFSAALCLLLIQKCRLAFEGQLLAIASFLLLSQLNDS